MKNLQARRGSPGASSGRRGKNSRPTDYPIALHEAAHIIAAREFKFVYGKVMIEPNQQDGSFGAATVICPFKDWKRGDGSRRTTLAQYVTGLYADAAAMAYYKGVIIDIPVTIEEDQAQGESLLSGDA